MDLAVQQFATAANGNSDARAVALEAATVSLAQAKRYLANYQNYVQEVEPRSQEAAHVAAGAELKAAVPPTGVSASPAISTSSTERQSGEHPGTVTRKCSPPPINGFTITGAEPRTEYCSSGK